MVIALGYLLDLLYYGTWLLKKKYLLYLLCKVCFLQTWTAPIKKTVIVRAFVCLVFLNMANSDLMHFCSTHTTV